MVTSLGEQGDVGCWLQSILFQPLASPSAGLDGRGWTGPNPATGWPFAWPNGVAAAWLPRLRSIAGRSGDPCTWPHLKSRCRAAPRASTHPSARLRIRSGVGPGLELCPAAGSWRMSNEEFPSHFQAGSRGGREQSLGLTCSVKGAQRDIKSNPLLPALLLGKASQGHAPALCHKQLACKGPPGT